MKTLNVKDEKCQLAAEAHIAKGMRFEVIGFDLDIPEHRAFWEKVKITGKFNSLCEPKVRATFIPAD